MYMFNGLVLNPAYAGSRDALSFTTIGRYQWLDIEGAPKTAAFGLHGRVREKAGLGIWGEYDEIGVHTNARVYASYSYTFLLSPKAKLAAGIQGGMRYAQSNFSEINPGVIDPVFSANPERLLPNFGVGLYFYTPSMYLGISVPHLLDNDLESATALASEYRHYYLNGGLVVPLGANVKLKPSFLIKSVPAVAPIQADITLSFLFAERLWLGATYRTEDSVDGIIELQVSQNLRLGYSYDYTLTELADYNSGSHEVMIGFDFGGPDKRKVVTPRYF